MSGLVMLRTLVLLVAGAFALVGCEPGRCLRHSDCPAGASCKSGVCRLPPKQSTSLAQPADDENQSLEPRESVNPTQADAGLGLGESQVTASSAQTVTAPSGAPSREESSSEDAGVLDGSTTEVSTLESTASDAALSSDASPDAAPSVEASVETSGTSTVSSGQQSF